MNLNDLQLDTLEFDELQNINGGGLGEYCAAAGGTMMGANIGSKIGMIGGIPGSVVGGFVGGAIGTIAYNVWK
ncbi:MAG: Blp family class II bacteriocin [Paraclostridium sordellii]|uniref:Blp family class II bacteriocin n=1 Tax=Paraclostridium sordellii TaxID=1505 RepID=UPI0005E95DA9|nr:Blp family class II bacteriocin [Paeniclostridium sordellii]MVO75955.1 hypothetical protein [Paeniclostridium sordellii]CEN29930.1 Bacteriocin class II with double-glycine leader peptide [[Clostridium] sordellii] [Paeniclostridium sordellii]CEN30445.1 Bacteriocin class II with double-glycine leader peptide [[Clostridium] sordellii] [Paeniclostridium sordellii]